MKLWKLPSTSLNKLVIALEGTIDEERGVLRRIVLLKHIESAVPPVQCGEKPLARQSSALLYSAGVESEKAIPLPSSFTYLPLCRMHSVDQRPKFPLEFLLHRPRPLLQNDSS